VPWDGDLGHLEGDIAAVADDLCADLDQLLFEARQRPDSVVEIHSRMSETPVAVSVSKV
jgi:hypothetical protein